MSTTFLRDNSDCFVPSCRETGGCCCPPVPCALHSCYENAAQRLGHVSRLGIHVLLIICHVPRANKGNIVSLGLLQEDFHPFVSMHELVASTTTAEFNNCWRESQTLDLLLRLLLQLLLLPPALLPSGSL